MRKRGVDSLRLKITTKIAISGCRGKPHMTYLESKSLLHDPSQEQEIPSSDAETESGTLRTWQEVPWWIVLSTDEGRRAQKTSPDGVSSVEIVICSSEVRASGRIEELVDGASDMR